MASNKNKKKEKQIPVKTILDQNIKHGNWKKNNDKNSTFLTKIRPYLIGILGNCLIILFCMIKNVYYYFIFYTRRRYSIFVTVPKFCKKA